MSDPTQPDPLLALASVSPADLRVRVCYVVQVVGALDEKRAEALRFLVDESDHSGARIAQTCRAAGVLLSAESINAHRRKSCACPA